MDHLNFKISNVLSNEFDDDVNYYLVEIYTNQNIICMDFKITKTGKIWFNFQEQWLHYFYDAFETIKYIIENNMLNHVYKEYRLKYLTIVIPKTNYSYSNNVLELIKHISNQSFSISCSTIFYNLVKKKFDIN